VALKKWKYQKYIKDYLRCVRGVDRGVGRVLDYLEENGLAKNTLVVYTSDQGFYLVNMVGLTKGGCMKNHLKCHF
jgi:arylsulfatase A-like enzyme